MEWGLLFLFVPAIFEDCEELICDWNLTILALCFCSLVPNLDAIEVDVSPHDGQHFLDPCHGCCEEGRTIDDPTIEDPSEVATGRNKNFLCIVLYTQTIELCNYRDDESALDCDVNCSGEIGHISVDRRRRVPFKAGLRCGSD